MVSQLDAHQQLSARLCAWDATGLLAAAGPEAGGSHVRGFRADDTSGEGIHLARKGFDKNAVSWPTGGYALRETEEAASTGHFVACRVGLSPLYSCCVGGAREESGEGPACPWPHINEDPRTAYCCVVAAEVGVFQRRPDIPRQGTAWRERCSGPGGDSGFAFSGLDSSEDP
ncbi:unnamed protein product [Rangifer tarandus platyrhynchus]|uniref:Uncharacterized protein n=2 Tax=Rangifer tarandus platyrhynchus TaxID=3082113 RepID=A0ABN8Y2P8_RANTA|nr:unnamed protein product [Rangifer tarandus platyrhynchus]CAI9713288.1 unnamed protein product [Rangifer tarandus platyrhynchus]